MQRVLNISTNPSHRLYRRGNSLLADRGTMMAKTVHRARRPAPLALALVCFAPIASQSSEADGLTIVSTAVLVTPLNEPRMVRGDDGRDHVEYDLLVTNAFAAPGTLTAVEVTSPSGTVLGRVDGATLAAATPGVPEQAPVSAIPASGAATVEVDLALALARGHRFF